MWFFCGENVVDCVANVDKFLSLFAREKWDRGFNFIFGWGLEGCSVGVVSGYLRSLMEGDLPLLIAVDPD
jgi:hypothetical protein